VQSKAALLPRLAFEMYHKILDEAIQELKDDEFKGLFPDDKPKPFISFTQIDTDLEILIPNEYVTSLSERYNLYSELSKLGNETELAGLSATTARQVWPDTATG
jgi:transcription-repair coupling factor (superfamily II helicase)